MTLVGDDGEQTILGGLNVLELVPEGESGAGDSADTVLVSTKGEGGHGEFDVGSTISVDFEVFSTEGSSHEHSTGSREFTGVDQVTDELSTKVMASEEDALSREASGSELIESSLNGSGGEGRLLGCLKSKVGHLEVDFGDSNEDSLVVVGTFTLNGLSNVRVVSGGSLDTGDPDNSQIVTNVGISGLKNDGFSLGAGDADESDLTEGREEVRSHLVININYYSNVSVV